MKFNPEEISLCKQIAERDKKKLKCGDWILLNGEIKLNLDGKLVWKEDGKHDLIITITKKVEAIPLWTISDCLEFLKERKWHISHCFEAMNKKYHSFMIKIAENHVSSEDSRYRDAIGDTLLEACLKVVLAVLEDLT